MTAFRARAVAAHELEELNTFSLVMAEEDGSGARLEIQRGLSFDEIRLRPEMAKALGLDEGISIEMDPASHPLVQASMSRLVT